MKEEYIPELGKVHITKRKHSKRITVRYDPKGKIKVSLPKNISYKAGLKYIHSKKSTIKSKIKILQDEQNDVEFNDYQTKWHKVILKPEERADAIYQIKNSDILIRFPYQTDRKDPWLQSIVREGVETALRNEAKNYLPYRLFELGSQYNLHFNKVYIKNVRTLWGSCSSKNNINLNIHLMRLPDHLIDYVLLHELCHTVYKNHSDRFWKLLNTCVNEDIPKLKSELRAYHPRLF
ncbi:MAG: M48 family metallopeptidase [Bacteroidales bacterium]|nr:M48 family metallopeptidase [Bacteroidales bacterium]